ncbi:hypothetical protein N658DRAFT_507638 [Parathielavia hyrcaniae]|uniref:Yeast cell wall synthesis Kre9/Knh1-like N-terminal domain-containing protein n=1 Tax=Parathielavia hyrcaniae TaxID=113614 RepID=A0AAN6PZE7_9PEZI|nr:hypothetical protein N658DRAFT_507638 [Parathielavia hyrcaniae]
MRFSVAAVLALAASLVQAQTAGFHPITAPTEGEEVPAGATYEIVWQPSAAHPGDITIGLLGGSSPGTLNIIDTIAAGVDGATGSFSWPVPATLGNLATYGIMITLDSDTSVFQFGFPFKIVGGSSASSSASATGSASATTTADETSASASESASATGDDMTSTTVTVMPPSTTLSSSTLYGNSTTTARSTITSLSTVVPSSTTSATSTIATNGVVSLAAGSFAMLGGVAMAVFAL